MKTFNFKGPWVKTKHKARYQDDGWLAKYRVILTCEVCGNEHIIYVNSKLRSKFSDCLECTKEAQK